MQSAASVLREHIENIEKIIIEYSINEKEARAMLESTREELKKAHPFSEEENEYYKPAVYNALATIDTVYVKEKKSRQLMEALVEAKEELLVIEGILTG